MSDSSNSPLRRLQNATKLPGESLADWSKGYRALTDDDKAELKAELEANPTIGV